MSESCVDGPGGFSLAQAFTPGSISGCLQKAPFMGLRSITSIAIEKLIEQHSIQTAPKNKYPNIKATEPDRLKNRMPILTGSAQNPVDCR